MGWPTREYYQLLIDLYLLLYWIELLLNRFINNDNDHIGWPIYASFPKSIMLLNPINYINRFT